MVSEPSIEKGSVMDVSEDTKLAVKKGVVWLDEHYPKWLDAIDLSTLEMERADACVLGQVDGDFWKVVSEHRLHASAAELGFDSPEATRSSFAWNELQAAWEGKIKELRDE